MCVYAVSELKAGESVPFDEIMVRYLYFISSNACHMYRISLSLSLSLFPPSKSGVVFVLSGFKNPYRGELREKAMEMGAKYEADWNDSCTHLV